MDDDQLVEWIKLNTQSDRVIIGEVLQELWSGYGKIQRFHCQGSHRVQGQDDGNSSVIVKYIDPPSEMNHPRGWNSSLSHERKLHSYQVELNWYQHWVGKCDQNIRVPGCIATNNNHNGQLILLEDLDASGYFLRKQSLTLEEIASCLKWLANFHGYFIGEKAKGLWSVGSYWHLATRPEEFEQMQNQQLKNAAKMIDEKLNHARYQTIIHGDAKVANFCFSESADVAAVDFQYVGGGCGMKDVAYFLGSCLDDSDLDTYAEALLDQYFNNFNQAVTDKTLASAVEKEWRELYPYAWADFYRFLNGWMPSHKKVNGYIQKITDSVLT